MSIYGKRERYDWRCRARRLALRINVLLAAASIALLASSVSAAPRCPGGGAPDARGRCAYQLRGENCAWPAKLVRIGSVTVCWRAAAVVQP